MASVVPPPTGDRITETMLKSKVGKRRGKGAPPRPVPVNSTRVVIGATSHLKSKDIYIWRSLFYGFLAPQQGKHPTIRDALPYDYGLVRFYAHSYCPLT